MKTPAFFWKRKQFLNSCCSVFSNFCTVATKKIRCEVYEDMSRSPHILRKKSQKMPYLDNEFLEVPRTKWDPKQFLLCWLASGQIWLIPFVDDCQST